LALSLGKSRGAGSKRKRRIVFNDQQASDLTKVSGQRMNSSKEIAFKSQENLLETAHASIRLTMPIP
jgi:hypothetical protein